MRRRNRLNLSMVLAVVMAGCVPMAEGDLPNGDHVVTTYVRLQGFSEARDDNLWLARRRCGGSVVLIEESNGVDDNGAWDRLVYGCAEPTAEQTR